MSCLEWNRSSTRLWSNSRRLKRLLDEWDKGQGKLCLLSQSGTDLSKVTGSTVVETWGKLNQ